MKFDELLITTGVDSLVRLVKEKKRIELEIASQLLGIPTETVEEWARVLEEQGILSIDYRLTKIYLTWVTPTAEELEKESVEFEKRKAEIADDIKELKESIEPEIRQAQELEQVFDRMYAEMQPRIAELEKKISALGRVAAPGERLGEYTARMERLGSAIEELQDGIGSMKAELAAFETSSSENERKRHSELLSTKLEELRGFEGELGRLKSSIAEQQKSASQLGRQLPSIAELRKKHEEVKAQFVALRKKTENIRQDMVSLGEGADVVESVGKSIQDYDGKLSQLRKQAKPLAEETEKLASRAAKLGEMVKADAETLERFSDSINVAKGILGRFPSQDKVIEELEGIRKLEAQLSEKSKALESLLKIAGGSRVSASDYAQLGRAIDKKMDEVHLELGELEKMVADESSTFATYQKVREKMVPALSSYQEKAGTLNEELKNLKKELASEAEGAEQELDKARQIMEEKGSREVLDALKDIKKKKELMDEIKTSLGGMADAADKLNKKVNLISKQMQLLQLRTGGKMPEGGGSGEIGTAIRKEIELTRDEGEEFKKKRKELRDLIRRLWDEN